MTRSSVTVSQSDVAPEHGEGQSLDQNTSLEERMKQTFSNLEALVSHTRAGLERFGVTFHVVKSRD